MTQIKKCWQTSSDLFYALIAGVDLPTPDGEQETAIPAEKINRAGTGAWADREKSFS
jgi:hypothetical protein